jgi:hypothetical protein
MVRRIDRLEAALQPVAPPLAQYEQACQNMRKRLYMTLYETLGADKYSELRDLLEVDDPPHGCPDYYRHKEYYGTEEGLIEMSYAEAEVRNIIKWPGFDNTPEQEARDREIIERWLLAHGIDPDSYQREAIEEWREYLERVSEDDWSILFEDA